MLKHNKPFDPEIDNQQRSSKANKDSKMKSTTRRFQAYDVKAPVTKRQRKKRLERKVSHSIGNTKSGIMPPVPLGDILTDILPQLQA